MKQTTVILKSGYEIKLSESLASKASEIFASLPGSAVCVGNSYIACSEIAAILETVWEESE